MTKQRRRSMFGLAMFAVAAVGYAGGSNEADRSTPIDGLGRFTGVLNTTAAEVVIHVGEEFSVRADGNEKALNQIVIDVHDGALRIRRPWRPWWFIGATRVGDVRVEVRLPRLDSVRLTGSGDARVEGRIAADSLSLQTTGSGRILAAGETDTVSIRITGSGDIDYSGRSRETDLELNASGSADIEIETETLDARITGSGDIDIRGATEELELRVTGSGQFQGDSFTANTAEVTITGSGEVYVAVQQTLDARLTGSGDLRITGGSPQINGSTTGSGRILE